jgi:Mg-chelatase subunit ChlD
MRLLALSALVLLLSGCSTCPKVERLDATADEPALIQVLFSVQCRGEPVTTLSASDLTLFEDGEEVSRAEADWQLDQVNAVLETYTLLLIDVSASIIGDGTIDTAREVAKDFARDVVDQGQLVSVAIFDGAELIRTVIDFTDDHQALVDAIDGIDADDQQDPSTNLNGAIVQGLEVLDTIVSPDVEAELESVASLVVFTDGVDLAGRTSDSKARSEVNSSDHHVFIVGLVDEEEAGELEELAKDGFFQASDPDTLSDSFGDLVDDLVAEVGKFYRLTYCSPLRSPRTTLRIQVGWDGGSDTISYSYPTREFGAGCSLPGS